MMRLSMVVCRLVELVWFGGIGMECVSNVGSNSGGVVVVADVYSSGSNG